MSEKSFRLGLNKSPRKLKEISKIFKWWYIFLWQICRFRTRFERLSEFLRVRQVHWRFTGQPGRRKIGFRHLRRWIERPGADFQIMGAASLPRTYSHRLPSLQYWLVILRLHSVPFGYWSSVALMTRQHTTLVRQRLKTGRHDFDSAKSSNES